MTVKDEAVEWRILGEEGLLPEGWVMTLVDNLE